jgi:hypothetical protein
MRTDVRAMRRVAPRSVPRLGMRVTVPLLLVNLLAACGGEGGSSSTDVGPANQAPTAQFSAASAGAAYTFDASQSSDADGSIDHYHWRFGDGGEASGARSYHRYGRSGRYRVTLTVTDSGGSSATSSETVEVTGDAVWRPAPGTAWQVQLSGPLDTSFDVAMYMVDLFDTAPDTVSSLHQAGRIVICHFSAGWWEPWRSDAGEFPAEVRGAAAAASSAQWLDIRRTDIVAPLMQARLDEAVQRGCDGVAPANVDGYTANTGFDFSAQDQIAYNRWLAEQAHARGLSVGLVDDLDQVVDLLGDYDWTLNHGCFERGECDRLAPFVDAGKAVFGVEYALGPDQFCAEAVQRGFDFLHKRVDLGAWRLACDAQLSALPPQAVFDASVSGQAGDTWIFDASRASDDGMLVQYQWDFGDGSGAAGQSRVTHAYAAEGTYNVSLTVTDDTGLSDSYAQPITVSVHNASPIAGFTTNTLSGVAPLTVTLDASSSSDDGDITGYAWSFGEAGASATGRTAMHVYNQPGNYTVTLTVTDDAGLTATASKRVVVAAAPVPAGVWQPSPGTSWQWQLTGNIDTSVDVQMYDIDLFDASQSVIDALHGQGRVVICYFSAGSWEDWRPDAGDFPAAVKGDSNGWPGERWLDIRAIDALSPIMQARLDRAVAKGCDGVEPDNIDGYSNRSGFPLSYADQLAYNRWLADAAHVRGLSIGLKNDLDQVKDLEPYFDWALNEQCFEYDECDLLLPFVQAGKAVFGVEYSGNTASFCPQSNSLNFDWLKKKLDLDAWREACR